MTVSSNIYVATLGLQVQWQKLSKLPQRDMEKIANLEMLGVSLRAKSAAAGLFGGGKRRRRPMRKVPFVAVHPSSAF